MHLQRLVQPTYHSYFARELLSCQCAEHNCRLTRWCRHGPPEALSRNFGLVSHTEISQKVRHLERTVSSTAISVPQDRKAFLGFSTQLGKTGSRTRSTSASDAHPCEGLDPCDQALQAGGLLGRWKSTQSLKEIFHFGRPKLALT